MEDGNGRSQTFATYAWITLACNLVVILWGVFLRASHSGDGCGQHWLTCQGEVIPSAPQLKTVIEFSHRVSTAIVGLVVVGLVFWAFRATKRADPARWTVVLSLVFIVVEALIGRGLVLTGNTADNWTPSRPYWTGGHLINTFLLVSFLALTAWFARGNGRIAWRQPAKVWLVLAIGFLAILLIGVSGSMAALTNMLFPSDSLSAGLAQDLDPNSNYLLRLRIFHPILSIILAVYLVFLAGWLRKRSPGRGKVISWSNILTILVIAQIVFGAATLLTLAPILMQLGHLLLADLVLISFVLLSASYLTASESAA
ncbi:MAG TPA: COX15/CtaA family protein [Pyrinomonadaceae bacterium]|jgi:heme A synthase